MASILVVSADPATRETLRESLEERGHTLSVCQEAAGVVRAFTVMAIDLVCLDAAAGEADSIDDICRWLPADSSRANIAILFVLPLGGHWTAAAVPPLFRPDCDDCLPRPLDTDALKEKVSRLLAASPVAAERGRFVRSSPFTVDTETQELWANGRKVALTGMECRLLKYLMERPGAVIGNDELLEMVWGFHPGTGAAPVVRVHVGNLRRKMAALGGYAGLLETLPHRGYRLLQGEGC